MLALEFDDNDDVAIKKAYVESSEEEADEGMYYELTKQVVPDYKQPAEEDIGSTSEEDTTDTEAGMHV